MPELTMYNTHGRNVNPFDPPKASIATGDEDKFIAWVRKLRAEGWLLEAEHEEFLGMLRAMSKKRQAELSKPYNPTPEQVAADRANRPSGKGQKPMPKPVRDYRGTQMPKGEWQPIRTKW